MAEVVLPQSLSERIAQASYAPATEADLPDGVTIEDDGSGQRVDVAGTPQPEAQNGMPPGGPADTQSYPAAPAGMPQYDPALVQQIAQRAQHLQTENQRLQMEQRMAALQADEQRFADSIAHLPAWQQEQLLHKREREQAQTINMHLQQKLMQLTDQVNASGNADHEKAEMVAKRIIAFNKAKAAGLDFSNPVVFGSLTGEHIKRPEDMDAHIQGFLQLGVSGQKPIIAGGARATNAGAPGPKKGSGDLAGLITSRSYELVPTD